MDEQQLSESVPVNDTVAMSNLAAFVADNRQHLPPTPKPVDYPALAKAIAESDAATEAGREARNAAAAHRALAREESERQGRLANLIRQAGHRYADCTLATFKATSDKQRRAAEGVVAYCDMLRDAWESSSLILFGPVGTGKDHLAIAVARILIEDLGKRVEWLNGQDWFGRVRDAMDSNRPEADLIRVYATPDVLVLSDPVPPVGSLTQHQSTMLYRLIDARYSRGVPTICTVNVKDSAEADERLGAATWDRLCHGAWTIHCNWPSYRKPAREIR